MSNYKKMRIWGEGEEAFKKCLLNSEFRIKQNLPKMESSDYAAVHLASKSLSWAGFSAVEIELIKSK